MKQLVAIGCVLLFAAGIAGAQSNETLDQILDSGQATYGQAAYLLLLGDGALDEQSDFATAVNALEDRIGVLVARGADEPITLGEFALLIQTWFDLPRGLMGRLVVAPRYAVRDLRFLRIVQGRSYPGMDLAGERMVRIVGRVLDYQEGVL